MPQPPLPSTTTPVQTGWPGWGAGANDLLRWDDELEEFIREAAAKRGAGRWAILRHLGKAAGIAYVWYEFGSIPSVPRQPVSPAELRRAARSFETARHRYEDLGTRIGAEVGGAVNPELAAETRRSIDALVDASRLIQTQLREMVRVAPRAADDPLGDEPGATAINRQALPALRRSVAVSRLWIDKHHREVHIPMAEAEYQRAARSATFAHAVPEALEAGRQVMRYVTRKALPQLDKGLAQATRTLERIGTIRLPRLEREVRTGLQPAVRRLTTTVRRLTIETLPELRRRIRTWEETLPEVQRRAITRSKEYTDAQVEPLTKLATMTAPLIPFIRGPVTTATRKSQRMEPLLDRLINPDAWMGLLLLGSFPNLVKLMGEMLGRVMGHVPDVLVAIEDHAARAVRVV